MGSLQRSWIVSTCLGQSSGCLSMKEAEVQPSIKARPSNQTSTQESLKFFSMNAPLCYSHLSNCFLSSSSALAGPEHFSLSKPVCNILSSTTGENHHRIAFQSSLHCESLGTESTPQKTINHRHPQGALPMACCAAPAAKLHRSTQVTMQG